jgi:hypothetical protein
VDIHLWRDKPERRKNIGMGPFAMEEGDIVVILFGETVPYVLRPRGVHYLLVGECYVYGIMEGEAIRFLQQKGELENRTNIFNLNWSTGVKGIRAQF